MGRMYMMPIITPFPSPKSNANDMKLCAKDDKYIMNDIAIPATKQVMLEDTFLAYRVTKGIEMALLRSGLLVPAA